MQKIDLNRLIIETTIDRALHDIEIDSDRTLRKLVDMVQDFSQGTFQKAFFQVIQDMIADEASAYYTILKRLAATVNHDTIKTFGVNLGYVGCTQGAGIIRRNEAAYGFNIPWAISFYVNQNEGAMSMKALSRYITQGKDLGVYVYLLVLEENVLPGLLPVLEAHPDAAFFLFVKSSFLDMDIILPLSGLRNILMSASLDADIGGAAALLAKNGFLFGIHGNYNADNTDFYTSKNTLQNIESYAPLFYFLFADSGCMPNIVEEMRQFATASRNNQAFAFLPVEMDTDLLAIDQIISEDACAVCFDARGCLTRRRGIIYKDTNSLAHASLFDILRANNPKVK